MVYISEKGQISSRQSYFRLSIIPDVFWGIVNFIVLFFQTMFSPNLTKHGNSYSSDYRPGGGPPRPPSRRVGRIRGDGGGAASPGHMPPPGGG